MERDSIDMLAGTKIKQILLGEDGFTLLELVIAISIFSIMALFAAPRISKYLSSERENFIILTSIISKTFDDSFIKGHTNFLIIHLDNPNMDLLEYNDELFSHSNGISVARLDDEGKFIETSNKLLKHYSFPSSFRIENVLLPGGETVSEGNVLIPFYPIGFSDDAVIHILVKDSERWSVRIFKLKKEPEILPEYVSLDEKSI